MLKQLLFMMGSNYPYATWNPLDTQLALSNGNLTATPGAPTRSVRSTIGKSSDKWYWECVTATDVYSYIGVAYSNADLTVGVGLDANGWGYNPNGAIYNNSSPLAVVATYANGDVIGIAIDPTAGTVKFYKNNALQYTATGLSGTVYAAVGLANSTACTANFGKTAQTYSPPAGYNAGLYA